MMLMVARSRLPKNPVKGRVYTISVRGRLVDFLATGKEGFGKYRIVKKED